MPDSKYDPTGKENTYFSNKITFLNIVLTIMIVVLHSNSPERFGLSLNWDFPLIYCVTRLCLLATPLFFFISGMLFYKGCSIEILGRKLTSRVYSLLVPYLIWNLFYVLVFFLMSRIDFFSSRMNSHSTISSLHDFAFCVLNSNYSDLWFIRNLLVYVALSPVLLQLFKNTNFSLLLLVLFVGLAILFPPQYDSLFRWFPVYYMGAVCGYNWDGKIGFILKKRYSVSVYGLFSVLLLFMYLFTLKYNNDLLFVYFSPLLVWFIVDGLLYKSIYRIQRRKWMGYMFFIYCTHHFVLNILQKIIVLICSPTSFLINVTFILSPVVTMLFLVWFSSVFSKKKIYAIISGGRI